jgi:STE24 endopeptidase
MKNALLLTFLLISAIELALSWVNLRHLRRHGAKVPPGFESNLDQQTLAKAAAYTIENYRLGLAESLFGAILIILFLFCGVIGQYDHWISTLSDSFILQGIFFFVPLYLLQSVLDIPFSLYRNFSLEDRYGFNTMTPVLWVTDLIKSMLLGLLLISLVVAGAFGLVLASPHGWWLWVWGFLTLITLAILYLSPSVIEPLFFHFEPIKSSELENEIQSLMCKAGLEVSRVLQVDASRRSKHSNAYFTGIGRVKRIVLFDTLLERLDTPEILAVLAHEAGHWKAHHLLKRLITTEVLTLTSCFTAFQLLQQGRLPALFGITMASFPAQLVLLGFLFSIISTVLSPIGAWLSRRQEREADRYAAKLSQTPDALASSLVKMSRDNLSNLYPHPLYAAVYYSHPPVVERVLKLTTRDAQS